MAGVPVRYEKGGKTHGTRIVRLHDDERVIPSSKRNRVERLMKRDGMNLTNRKRGRR